MSANELTQERQKTHGDWHEQSSCANHLKRTAHSGESWSVMSESQQEAIDMILTKVSRIVTGDPHEPDHWNDIEGYAHLGKGEPDAK